MTDRPPQITVLLTLRSLPPHCRPAIVNRMPGLTLVTLDPTATCLQVLEYVVDNLSPEEQNGYRAAFGQPPVGHPLADPFTSEDQLYTWPNLPESLLTPRGRRIRAAAGDTAPADAFGI